MMDFKFPALSLNVLGWGLALASTGIFVLGVWKLVELIAGALS